MSKRLRLIDFQVFAGPAGLPAGGQRSVNESLFTTYEPVRLWLKEREIGAPFRKIVVSLSDEASFTRWHGQVTNAIGICEVTEATNMDVVAQRSVDHHWVLGIVEHALGCVAQSTGWRSEPLELFIKELSRSSLPLVHEFEKLTRVDKVSGARCVLWLSTRPGETRLGGRIGQRDVILRSEPGPLYMEDSFPVVKSAIRGRDYVLFDKGGKELASVPIDASALH